MSNKPTNFEPDVPTEENCQETPPTVKQFDPPVRIVKRGARFGQMDKGELEFMRTETTYKDNKDTLITEDEIIGVVASCGHRISGPSNVPGKCNHPRCGYVCQDCLVTCPRGGSRCLQTMCKRHSIKIDGVRYCMHCAKVLLFWKCVKFAGNTIVFPFVLLAKIFRIIFITEEW